MPKVNHKRQLRTKYSLCGVLEGMIIDDNTIYLHRLMDNPVRVTCPACAGKFTKEDVDKIIQNNININAFIERNKNNHVYHPSRI